jgi:1-acyl-sn-glycerol-3-phosphate acyltransferase
LWAATHLTRTYPSTLLTDKLCTSFGHCTYYNSSHVLDELNRKASAIRSNMGKRLARSLIKLFLRLTSRTEVYGSEFLPPKGSIVVASNHLGRLDALYVYRCIDREDIILLAAKKYQKYAIARWFSRQLDAIWVDRYKADIAATRSALRRLKAGGVLVLAPEGTRSKTGKLQKARVGGSYLAAKAGVPIIPVAITGTEDALVFSKLIRLKRSHVVVRASEPFTLPPIPKEGVEAALQEYTDEIMCRIAAMLPPSYRGFYADHPRLHELLDGQESNK